MPLFRVVNETYYLNLDLIKCSSSLFSELLLKQFDLSLVVLTREQVR